MKGRRCSPSQTSVHHQVVHPASKEITFRRDGFNGFDQVLIGVRFEHQTSDPERSTSRIVSSESCMVRTTTAVEGEACSICMAAADPSSRGIEKSRMATSGRRSRAFSTASMPFTASLTTRTAGPRIRLPAFVGNRENQGLGLWLNEDARRSCPIDAARSQALPGGLGRVISTSSENLLMSDTLLRVGLPHHLRKQGQVPVQHSQLLRRRVTLSMGAGCDRHEAQAHRTKWHGFCSREKDSLKIEGLTYFSAPAELF